MSKGVVHITGMGVVSAIGIGVATNLEALMKERSGIGPITHLRTRHRGLLPVGEVPPDDAALGALATPTTLAGWTRTALLGLVAIREALAQAGLDPGSPRVGLISATTAGGIDKSEDIYTRFFEDDPPPEVRQYIGTHDPGEHAERIAREVGVGGMVTTISTACSSSANAMIFGARLIQAGLLDAAIVGGADALCRFTINGFNSLLILDGRPCLPFDRGRAGLNLGEAGGYLILESEEHARQRGAEPLARLSGFANTNEAFHATASSPQGEGALMAMERALVRAGLAAADIDHINVHGTGTLNNDLSEGMALSRLFGNNVPPFTSTKSFTGHTLGAAGAVEAIYSVLALRHGAHFATLRSAEPMEEVALTPVSRSTTGHTLRHVLSNSFGFGGNNTALIISQP